MNCPNCGFKINGKKGADRRLLEDQKKAKAAFDALSRRLIDGRRYFPNSSLEDWALMQEAIVSEQKRLMEAITEPKVLWGIYRRTDKKQPYYESVSRSTHLKVGTLGHS